MKRCDQSVKVQPWNFWGSPFSHVFSQGKPIQGQGSSSRRPCPSKQTKWYTSFRYRNYISKHMRKTETKNSFKMHHMFLYCSFCCAKPCSMQVIQMKRCGCFRLSDGFERQTALCVCVVSLDTLGIFRQKQSNLNGRVPLKNGSICSRSLNICNWLKQTNFVDAIPRLNRLVTCHLVTYSFRCQDGTG